MKTKKYFIIPLIGLLAGCSAEDSVTTKLASGEEVKFGASLGQNGTRTIYGPEDNNAFPIYWVDGDEVIVGSPQCAEAGGIGSATYKVAVDNSTQNYATSMDKSGDTGVRWGDNEKGDFYSVYPAKHAAFSNGFTNIKLTMPYQQDCSIVEEGGKNIVRPDMDACFMYAKTTGVKSGDPVTLKYIPLSTAIRFTLNGPTSGDPVTISDIEFHAPAGTSIAGTFNADLSAADNNTLPATSVIDGSNVVTMNATYSTGGYLTLATGESIEMNVFLLLTGETEITDDWYIKINTSTGYAYKKSLGGQFGGNKTLVPGNIHRLPDLPALDENGKWDPSNWMVNIRRNVYLSEISIPGTWNSLNKDFQGKNPSIDAQYKAGARAFHIDARWKGSYDQINGYNVSGLGIANGGNTAGVIIPGGGRIMTSSNPSFESTLTEITNHVKPDEYMVVICTFAQDSYDYDRDNGGWEKEISDICAANPNVIDAKTLTSESVVADVLGKVIVIVNTENAVSSLSAADSRCLFMNMGMTLDQNTYINNKYTNVDLTDGGGAARFDTYGTHAQIMADSDPGYNTSTRGYAPSFSERQERAGNILAWSQDNYKKRGEGKKVHDTWMYLGLGGYQAKKNTDVAITGSYNNVANILNGWIDGKVSGMATGGYYPVGIVLMNFLTESEHSEVANDILQLNNKYRLDYDADRSPIDGSARK